MIFSQKTIDLMFTANATNNSILINETVGWLVKWFDSIFYAKSAPPTPLTKINNKRLLLRKR